MVEFRKILPSDNQVIAQIVIAGMSEFGADPKTTILGDEAIYTMYENFDNHRAVYYVVTENDVIIGGSGVNQLDGSKENVCELQRMFLLPESRGKGIGKKLIELSLEAAKDFGYEKIYLESLSNMDSALALYKKSGFEFIPKPLGNTGHSGCNIWMSKKL